MNLHLKVTQDHIDRGRPGEGDSCPVALALKEALVREQAVAPSELGVSVGEQVVMVFINGERLGGVLPQEAGMFVTAFDAGHDEDPFEFDLWLHR